MAAGLLLDLPGGRPNVIVETEDAVRMVNRIYARLNGRRTEVDKSEEYYEGKQPLNFATDEWRKANAARYDGFSDNWCGTVVNAEAERLKPIGISMKSKTAARALWDDLQMNEFDMKFSQGVISSLASKRCYAIVWGDRDGVPILTFEHPSFVEIEYSFENPGVRVAALKTWVDEEDEYATLYTPEHLWKFKRKRVSVKDERQSQAEQGKPEIGWEGGWEAREITSEVWPLQNPLGVVPVVELPNRPLLKGDPVSEIQGVMAMQDFINLMWAYLALAADYASMKARVVTGSDAPQVPILDKDTGAVVGHRPLDLKDFAEKRIAFLPGDAKIDEWEAARLDIFTDVIEIGVGHIAAQTRTPPHYLVANKGLSNLPADALKAAEIGLVKKADEFITFTDPALRELIRLVALVRGDEKAAAEARLAQFVWASREIRSESQLADALLKKKQMGYPLEYILELDGKSPSEIRRIMKMAADEQDALLGLGAMSAAENAVV